MEEVELENGGGGNLKRGVWKLKMDEVNIEKG